MEGLYSRQLISWMSAWWEGGMFNVIEESKCGIPRKDAARADIANILNNKVHWTRYVDAFPDLFVTSQWYFPFTIACNYRYDVGLIYRCNICKTNDKIATNLSYRRQLYASQALHRGNCMLRNTYTFDYWWCFLLNYENGILFPPRKWISCSICIM